MLLPKKIHPSWQPLLTEAIREEITRIETSIGNDFNPIPHENTLRFLETDLDHTHVIWLGQDVYPAEGVATGRAFEAGNIKSWLQPFRQVSLKNIVRAIYCAYFNIKNYRDIPPYSELKKQIKADKFPLLPPAQWFASLERQGVLFLNTSFTCRIGKPNSHKAIWSHFSHETIKYISARRPDMIWFLWGREAQANKDYISTGKIMESRHPSRVNEAYEDDFLKFDGFSKTDDIINWLG